MKYFCLWSTSIVTEQRLRKLEKYFLSKNIWKLLQFSEVIILWPLVGRKQRCSQSWERLWDPRRPQCTVMSALTLHYTGHNTMWSNHSRSAPSFIQLSFSSIVTHLSPSTPSSSYFSAQDTYFAISNLLKLNSSKLSYLTLFEPTNVIL